MASETLMELDTPVTGPDSRVYQARACGREREDGNWEGWLEFAAIHDGPHGTVWRTERETTQPNRADLVYWSTGLSAVFLEGALVRAMTPRPARRSRSRVRAAALAATPPAAPAAAELDVPDSIVDPYQGYTRGEVFLRRQLGALDAWHLRNVARAYRMADTLEVDELGKVELIELIVSHVRGAVSVAAAATR